MVFFKIIIIQVHKCFHIYIYIYVYIYIYRAILSELKYIINVKKTNLTDEKNDSIKINVDNLFILRLVYCNIIITNR